MDTQFSNPRKKPLCIMKFGGTSVGDATRIRKVVEIVRDAARDSEVVVVVSAMGGVTNRLVEAAKQSEAGNRQAVAAIFEELREPALRGRQHSDPFGRTAEPHQPRAEAGV